MSTDSTRIRTQWGLFRKRIDIEVEDSSISFYKRSFPLIGKMVKDSEFLIDDSITFFGNDNDKAHSKILYISKQGNYDSFPTTDSAIARDDKDDWTLTALQTDDSSQTDDLDADLRMYTSTYKLVLHKSDLVSIYDHLEKKGVKKAKVFKASGILLKKYIAYSDKWLYYDENGDIDSTPIEEMAFFVTNGTRIYCGYHRQVNAVVFSPSVRKEIKEHCFAISKKLNHSGKTYKAGFLHPDRLTITDEAVVYTRKTFWKDEMAYVPFQRINLVLTSRNLFFKNVNIFGEQNIIPHHKFRRKYAKEIIDVLKQYGIDTSSGATFSASKFRSIRNWFGRAPRIICVDNCVIYYPNRIKGGSQKLQSSMMKYNEISHVVWHKKTMALFGTLEILGVPVNIRQDQEDNLVDMILPQLWAPKYKWFLFKGSLNKILTGKCNAEFTRERNNFEI